MGYSSSDANLQVGGGYEKITIPAGVCTLRAERIIEVRKDGTVMADKQGDQFCLVIFEAVDGPGVGGDVSQRIYDEAENCPSEKGPSKLARSKKFIGSFLEKAGIKNIEDLEEIIGLMSKARIIHDMNGGTLYVNIKEWVDTATPITKGVKEKDPDFNPDDNPF